MKTKFILIASLVILLCACKKAKPLEGLENHSDIQKIKEYLKESLSESDFKIIALNKISFISEKGERKFATIPLGQVKGHFIFLDFSKNKYVGNKISLKINDKGDGQLENVFLNSNQKLLFDIKNNETEINVPQPQNASNIAEVVAMTVPARIDFEYGQYQLSLINFSMMSPGGNSNTYIVNPEPGGSDNGTGGGTYDLYAVEFDESENLPGEDITKIFKCFESVSDYGATYKIKLNADVPVNSYPTSALSYTGSPGHAFITITKSNGSNSVTKNFGFYPVNGKTSLGLGPVTSKIANDNQHEINASIELNLNQSQFDIIKEKAISLSLQPYDIDNFNCANFALDVFNTVQNPQIPIEKLHTNLTGPSITPSVYATIDKSPQMLFKRLSEIKNSNSPLASSIITSTDGSYKSPSSTGGCN